MPLARKVAVVHRIVSIVFVARVWRKKRMEVRYRHQTVWVLASVRYPEALAFGRQLQVWGTSRVMSDAEATRLGKCV